ncbi:metal-dependent hydrolase [Rhodococcus sp. BP-149]|jgi:predicted metal-dependent hydrolase|uniref:metal-dependent hydrolase n=2 Tax=Rhodococcus TaxID=1827 RepID=UPI0004817B02|nr:metal-dependent hydrolase [Rhodococcus sp. NBC_00297]MBY6677390.1 metal-dependent hydrolase [Rhodococcus sp. BP-332]MBY6680095.1 metal-dependent hydrolase [Rhodococcus sp. BP-316]MBY6687914.1 metal-dependent hydrolase [Rhodococcus sp. BP-288]MBY6696367.1 metal-dependent hydrolase [Rhodococcus sp. BP-188]MBY6700864.1 metal-dependent hydrolase [Rhodococcus sp. BP-285]MBY6701631.1 metal-dependent hydrolase [Rhodococcus sp. BP-283]MBY6712632.1 metal-dependent hydrolase [Rhodococcus sp. BP-160
MMNDDPGPVVLQARNVSFDWESMRMHYMDGDPLATHLMNVMHLFLPEGEEWFVRVFKEALPLIHDEKLRADVIGFIGQEAMHAQAHSGIHTFLADQGLDPAPYVKQMEYVFRVALDKRSTNTKNSLVERLALIAAIEHLTSFLGMWVLTEKGLDEADVDPRMLDLVRWHGAEEVEHRAVAYDVLQYFDTRRFRRTRTYLLVAPTVVVMWGRGLRFLMKNDPTLTDDQRSYTLKQIRAVTQRGLFPTAKAVGKASVRYLRKDYHPSKEGSTSLAVAYLATSPAARAATV